MSRKIKYNYEFKLQCVESLLKGERSIRSLSREEGISSSNLKTWLRFYRAYGASSLHPQRQRHYDPAFKLHVIETMNKEFLSLRTACIRFNIPSESVIIRWKRDYETKGLAGLESQPKGPKKMKQPIKRQSKKSDKPLTREEELLQENEYLRAENELLKKLQALAQTKKKRKP